MTGGTSTGLSDFNGTFLRPGDTFTTPDLTVATTTFKFTLSAGGGGGSDGADFNNGIGGGGATCIYYGTGLAGANSISLTIGTGGAIGVDGGHSSMIWNGTTITAGGGKGATAGNNGAGGIGTNGHQNLTGGNGGFQPGSIVGEDVGGGWSFWGGPGGVNPSNGGGIGNPGKDGLCQVEWVLPPTGV